MIEWFNLRKRNEESALAAKTKTKRNSSSGGVDQRLVKALAHPLRVEILAILNERMASPNELSKELEEGLSQVSYHVKVLKDFECIEMVKTEPRRGAVEHYYRATARAFLSDADWKKLPDSIKPGMSAAFIKMVIDDVVTSLNAGAFDAREDRHISWTPGVVDEQGWNETVDLVNETLEKVLDIQTASAKRLTKSDEEGIPATAVLMNFEGIPTEAKNAKGLKKKPRGRKAVK
jgi:DNA-binding transcriptional ArsR family regulator